MCICKEGDPQHVSCWRRLHCCGGRQSTHFVLTVWKEGVEEGRRGNEDGKMDLFYLTKKLVIRLLQQHHVQIGKSKNKIILNVSNIARFKPQPIW